MQLSLEPAKHHGKVTFEELLKNSFNLNSFREGQKQIISGVLAKKDVLAVLPTGGGKSLCYQFPALYLETLVIVISPLIALMKDQVASLRRQGIPAGCLYSGQSASEKIEIFNRISQGGTFILYLSPERVQKEGFQKWILHRSVGLFAIDEAHCVSQWGHDFREEYGQLSVLKTLRPDVPTLALTASATPTVLSDIAKQLRLRSPELRVHGFYRPNLYYQVEMCGDEDSKLELLTQALQQTPEGRVIVYCGTRKVTESIFEFLNLRFKKVGFYHAGLSNGERTQTQEAYTKGDLRILVATNAFGMGIDQPDVRLVVHYQMPANIDSLYQEMGRAGRDGLPSTCLMLYSKKDKGLQSYFIQSSEASAVIKNSRWRNLDALIDYAEGSECRHAEILTYYKDAVRIEKCGHCDNCDPESSRKILKPFVVPNWREVLSDDEGVFLPTLTAPAAKRLKPAKAKRADLGVVSLDEVQERRFQALRRWRKQKAIELDMPAFVVLSDQTLKYLAVKNPSNMDELRNIYGIGDAKIEKYGWDLMAELAASTT